MYCRDPSTMVAFVLCFEINIFLNGNLFVVQVHYTAFPFPTLRNTIYNV